jgi:hypothetical protein
MHFIKQQIETILKVKENIDITKLMALNRSVLPIIELYLN